MVIKNILEVLLPTCGHLDTEPVRCLHCQSKGHMSCAHVFE